MKAIVTGAAGFIGSHLADDLISQGWEVVGLDNLSSGRVNNIQQLMNNASFRFQQLDLRNPVPENQMGFVDVVFHLAADPEVRTGVENPQSQFENNVLATYNILEFVRKTKCPKLYVASSSTIYGEPAIVPTPEDYEQLDPISMYGSAKLACEVMASGYSKTFGFKVIVIRPANIVGSRATHGVLLDFIKKLQSNPKELEILGDGKQSKSYVHVLDVVSAIMKLEEVSDEFSSYEVFNIGNNDKTSVTRIAEIVSEEMHIHPTFHYTGGIEGGRAWKGDVRTVLLSIDRIEAYGWRPKLSSDESMRKAAREVIHDVKYG